MNLIELISKQSISSIQRHAITALKQILNYKYAHPTNLNWDWKNKNFNRIALVNYLISKNRGYEASYLEIGCAKNDLFDSVMVKKKIGVDPEAGGTHRMTSDNFFRDNNEFFDVIFIDGLHEYQQVRRDGLNSLQCIKPGGWIAFHDLLPSNWKEQHYPRINSSWTGDCWKFALELCNASGLDFKIVEIDQGVGILKKISDNFKVPDLSKELANANFDKFLQVKNEFQILSFDEAVKFIQSF